MATLKPCQGHRGPGTLQSVTHPRGFFEQDLSPALAGPGGGYLKQEVGRGQKGAAHEAINISRKARLRSQAEVPVEKAGFVEEQQTQGEKTAFGAGDTQVERRHFRGAKEGQPAGNWGQLRRRKGDNSSSQNGWVAFAVLEC